MSGGYGAGSSQLLDEVKACSSEELEEIVAELHKSGVKVEVDTTQYES